MQLYKYIQIESTRRQYLMPMLLMLMGVILALPARSGAEMQAMSDNEMESITGRQGFSEFTLEGNTARVFFDMHVETYMEVDSLKMGYYQKSDAGIGATGNLSTTKWSANGAYSYNPNYAYVKEFGISGPNLYTGPQGTGQNMNTYDWDVNWENVKLGKSESEPLIMNGLVLKVEFDDINAANKKLKRVVFGTNDMQGQISADMLRTSGMFNPVTTKDTQMRSLGSTNPANSNPLLLKRDGFNSNWNEYVHNASDNDTGFWVILNFGAGPNGETDHIGWEIVSGYDERAVNFSYKDGIQNLDLSGY